MLELLTFRLRSIPYESQCTAKHEEFNASKHNTIQSTYRPHPTTTQLPENQFRPGCITYTHLKQAPRSLDVTSIIPLLEHRQNPSNGHHPISEFLLELIRRLEMVVTVLVQTQTANPTESHAHI